MDNTTSPITDLDLNPDMMTTQNSIPPVTAPLNTPPVVSSGIIDITPGSSTIDIVNPIQHIDTATLPDPAIYHLTPQVSEIAPVNVTTTPTGVIDITPGESAPLSDGLTHLSDISSQIEPSLPVAAPIPNPLQDIPAEPAIPTPNETTLSTMDTAPATVTPLTTPTTSSLAEDPDLVKLVQ